MKQKNLLQRISSLSLLDKLCLGLFIIIFLFHKSILGLLPDGSAEVADRPSVAIEPPQQIEEGVSK